MSIWLSATSYTHTHTQVKHTIFSRRLSEAPLTHVAVGLDDGLAGSDQQSVDLDVLREADRRFSVQTRALRLNLQSWPTSDSSSVRFPTTSLQAETRSSRWSCRHSSS